MRWLFVGAAVVAALGRVAPARADEAFAGGLGKGWIGAVGGHFGDVEDSLRAADRLGAGAGIGNAGLAVGGGGFAMLGGVVLGGGGFALLVPTTDGERGTADLVGGGGGVELGYALVRNREWIVYPAFGVGGFGFGLEVTNVSGLPIDLGNEVIRAGQRGTYEAGFVFLDFGLRINRLLFFGGDDAAGAGGFAVGVDAGFLANVMRGDWQNEAGVVVEGLSPARLTGGYMRLTVGGGGFFFCE
jgi:hypothetical protein